MNVDICVFENLSVKPVALAVGADIAYSGTRALLHNVAKLARKGNFALALHCGNFYRQSSSAHGSPGKPRSRAHFVRADALIAVVTARTEIAFHALRGYLRLGLFAVCYFNGDLAADCVNLSFEISHARFERIARNYFVYRVVGKSYFTLVKPVRGAFFGNEISLCYFTLFFLRVAVQLDNFHSVQKRTGNGIERVCRGYE